MPVELRSRKSIHPRQASGLELETEPIAPRRSARLHGSTAVGRATYEESDESDSEDFQSKVMEKHESGPAELEEEAAEEIDVTELKHCSVVLDRLSADEKAAAKELEEKEEMNRKGGKAVSRIPTFHKRPSGASQSAELPVLRKDTPVHGAQPLHKAGSAETSKAKPPDVRETARPLPSIRAPRVSLEAPSYFSNMEQTASAACIAPKSWSFTGSEQLMTASPRPALRPQQGSEQQLPEQEKSRTSDVEADITMTSVSPLPHMGPLSFKPKEDVTVKYEMNITSIIPPGVSGDTEKSVTQSKPSTCTTEISHVDEIMDEEPPWVTEAGDTFELMESRSSSESECEEGSADEKSECLDSGQVNDRPKLESSHPTEEGGSVDDSNTQAANKSDTARPSKASKSSGRASFFLFFFLPTTLLLLGGFSQHIWHYGLPMSVAQLTAQLELHWLEGCGLMPEPCSTDCRVSLVESIPVGLYPSSPSSRQSIADSWLHLLGKANNSVHIAAFYFTLRGSDLQFADSTDSQGRRVFEQLKQLESRGINLQVAVNAPQTSIQDTAELSATGAEVREVDLKSVTGGIIHTKLWVVDQKHFYLGSANMDWRSLSQVKEVGLSVEDCSCLARDAYRIFGVYWSVGGMNHTSLPPYWPARLSAMSSSQNPLHLRFNGVPAQVYLSSAPPQLSARGRSDDLTTILSVINDAQKFVYISVMDYLPLSEFTEPLRFWPPIDSALRAAGCTRGVQVRLIVSCWKHSPASMFTFLQSLLVLSRPPLKCDIDVKVFTVPSTAEQKKIPFARVNHSKFMVTDRVVYIGTSNWSENYFTHTAGVGLVVNQTGSEVRGGQQTLQSQAEELFLRDWGSQYASPLSVDDVDVCPRGRH